MLIFKFQHEGLACLIAGIVLSVLFAVLIPLFVIKLSSP